MSNYVYTNPEETRPITDFFNRFEYDEDPLNSDNHQYLSIDDNRDNGFQYASRAVSTNAAVDKYIRENMTNIMHDTINFNLIIRRDGAALLFAKFSMIIGSRLLGYVSIDSVEEMLELSK